MADVKTAGGIIDGGRDKEFFFAGFGHSDFLLAYKIDQYYRIFCTKMQANIFVSAQRLFGEQKKRRCPSAACRCIETTPFI
jgi:hypothetical protein